MKGLHNTVYALKLKMTAFIKFSNMQSAPTAGGCRIEIKRERKKLFDADNKQL
jgi:hypothetical protein